MGAHTFFTTSTGTSPEDAYVAACTAATREHGRDPYNGTISTTNGFTMVRDTGKTVRATLARRRDQLATLNRAVRKGQVLPIDTPHYLAKVVGADAADQWVASVRGRRDTKRWATAVVRAALQDVRDDLKGFRTRMEPETLAHWLLRLDDAGSRFQKFGACGCIDLTPNRKRTKRYLFFGWAAS